MALCPFNDNHAMGSFKRSSYLEKKKYFNKQWLEYGKPATFTHPWYSQCINLFIRRQKNQIMHQLIQDINLLEISIIDVMESDITFSLTLKPINDGNNKNQYLVSCKLPSEYSVLICEHSSQQHNVLDLIQSIRYALCCKRVAFYEKDNSWYSVINIMSSSEERFNNDSKKCTYLEHIKDCKWLNVGNSMLYLYQTQMKGISTFVDKFVCTINNNAYNKENNLCVGMVFNTQHLSDNGM